MIIRHGNMIVGSTGAGKTTVSRIMAKALTQLHADGIEDPWYMPVHIDTLNPKSVTKGELYGESNPYTNEWQEGIVSILVKNAVEKAEGEDVTKDYKRWINFDGPVDAMWIESMNTVLDDNKMLCLPNGERIKMPDICTMMFEVNDLVEASPATVSRCGMVYLEPVYLGWEPLVITWSEINADEMSPTFLPFIVKTIITVISKLLPLIRKRCKESIPSADFNLVQTCLNLVKIFLNKEKINLDDKDKFMFPYKVIMTYLSFCFIWSFGANLHDDSRNTFMSFFRSSIKTVEIPNNEMIDLPDGDNLYDYTVDPVYNTFQPWDELKANF
jgi:dynein heavy chain